MDGALPPPPPPTRLRRGESQLEYDVASESYVRRVSLVAAEQDLTTSAGPGSPRFAPSTTTTTTTTTTEAAPTTLEWDDVTESYRRRILVGNNTATEAAEASTHPMAATTDSGSDLEYQPPPPRHRQQPPPDNPTPATPAEKPTTSDYLIHLSQKLFDPHAPTPEHHQDPQLLTTLSHHLSKLTKRFYRHVMFESIWLILSLLAMIMSIFAWLIDEVIEYLVTFREDIAKVPRSPTSHAHVPSYVKWLYPLPATSRFFLWWGWALVWGLGAVFVVRYIGPQAAGSGIEQVRSIQTGYTIPHYFEMNTLFAKIVGLVMAQASGLVVGKEGPFVHISCSIAHLLMQLPLFRDIRNSRLLRKQVIAAACATGISSTFGAPVGGVLFALEVTSNVFHTYHYWGCFFTAVVGEMWFRQLSYFGTARQSEVALFPTTFTQQPYLLSELPIFFVCAGVCGLYGGYFVKAIIGARTWRQDTHMRAVAWRSQPDAFTPFSDLAVDRGRGRDGEPPHVSDRLLSAMFTPDNALAVRAWWHNVSFVARSYYMRAAYYVCAPTGWAITVITLTCWSHWFTGTFMQRSLYPNIADFLVAGEMAQDVDTSNGGVAVGPDANVNSKDWGSPSLMLNLWVFFVLKSSLCVLALTLPVPTGTLILTLAIGLSMGRIFGETVQHWGGASYSAGGYALVGASAFMAGVTGAVSTAVIIFEITSQLSFMVPVLMAVVLGRAAGKVVSPDFYEALQTLKKLPNVPFFSHQSSYSMTAGDFMTAANIPVVKRFSTDAEVRALCVVDVAKRDEEDDLFAVVLAMEDPVYLGSVARHQLPLLLGQAQDVEAADLGSERERGSDEAPPAPPTMLDVLSLTNSTAIAPSIPASAMLAEALTVFEMTLTTRLFVVDHSRVVGWIDLDHLREEIEHGHL